MRCSSDLTTVGGRIRYYRLKQGLLQEEVADRSGIDISTIKRYESNQYEQTLNICNRIAYAIGIDPELVYDNYLKFISHDFGLAIKMFRNNNKLTQTKLCSMLCVNRKTITRWEKGRECPSRENFKKLELLIPNLLFNLLK